MMRWGEIRRITPHKKKEKNFGGGNHQVHGIQMEVKQEATEVAEQTPAIGQQKTLLPLRTPVN
jgi:hypothetical protein